MRRFVGALALVLAVPALGLAGDLATLAGTLAGRLRPSASTTPSASDRAPRYFNATGTAVRCVALTAAEVRSHGRHVFACATADGEVLGGFLSRRGSPVCEPITGTFDTATECWTLQICGSGFEGCFPS